MSEEAVRRMLLEHGAPTPDEPRERGLKGGAELNRARMEDRTSNREH